MKRQARLAGARDNAVRNLRDMTVAIAITAAAGVGLAAWVSAATIPASSGTSAQSGGVTGDTASLSTPSDRGLGPAPDQAPAGSRFGSAVAVSGGSR